MKENPETEIFVENWLKEKGFVIKHKFKKRKKTIFLVQKNDRTDCVPLAKSVTDGQAFMTLWQKSLNLLD